MSAVTHGKHHLPLAGLLNLFVTYVVWGSTYLAIRVAVREGAGWGPFWMGASRVLVAAALLFLFNKLRGARLRPTLAVPGFRTLGSCLPVRRFSGEHPSMAPFECEEQRSRLIGK